MEDSQKTDLTKNNHETEQAKQQLEEDKNHLKEKGSELMNDVQSLGCLVKKIAEDVWVYVQKGSEQCIEEGSRKMSSFEHQMKINIQQKPLKSLLIAAAAGFVGGAIYFRK